jgi:hypothetical protein
MHAGKASRSGAAQQPQQQRFSLIVERVADSHDVCTEHRPGPLEEFVPRGSRRILYRLSRALRARGDVLPIRHTAEVQPGGRRHHEPFISVGGVTELMIEMRDANELHFVRAMQIVKDLQKGNRIGAA